jgi:hypothetical protein
MDTLGQRPDFSEFSLILDELVTTPLRAWKFRKLKRRGIGNKPPVDFIQLYQRLFRPAKAHLIEFTALGLFQPIEEYRVAPRLLAWRDFRGGSGPGFYRHWLPRLLLDQGIYGNFTDMGWLIGDLLAESRATGKNEMLKMIDEFGIIWLAEQEIH